MQFAPKPGCPMCSIVASALHTSPGSPGSPVGTTQREVLWRDENFTAYRETAHPVSSKGHIIIAFKCVIMSLCSLLEPDAVHDSLHVPSLYTLVRQFCGKNISRSKPLFLSLLVIFLSLSMSATLPSVFSSRFSRRPFHLPVLRNNPPLISCNQINQSFALVSSRRRSKTTRFL